MVARTGARCPTCGASTCCRTRWRAEAEALLVAALGELTSAPRQAASEAVRLPKAARAICEAKGPDPENKRLPWCACVSASPVRGRSRAELVCCRAFLCPQVILLRVPVLVPVRASPVCMYVCMYVGR